MQPSTEWRTSAGPSRYRALAAVAGEPTTGWTPRVRETCGPDWRDIRSDDPLWRCQKNRAAGMYCDAVGVAD